MDASRPVREIEDELVALAINNSVPASFDTWDLDIKLRAIERTLVQTDGDYHGFAKLCQACSKQARHNPAAEMLFALGTVNGHRRIEGYNIDLVNSILKTVQKKIDLLDNKDPRKLRLRILHSYHGAIHAGNQGDYKRESEMLAQSALTATEACDKVGAAIATFRSKQAGIYAALTDGSNETIALVTNFGKQELNELQEAMLGTSSAHGVWDLFNGPVAVTMVSFLVQLVPAKSVRLNLVNCLTRIHDEQNKVFREQAGAWHVARAIIHYFEAEYDNAWDQAASAFSPEFKTQPEYVAIAHLLIGRMAGNNHTMRTRYRTAANTVGLPPYIKTVAEFWQATVPPTTAA